LEVGLLVGWQELGINPATLTPQTVIRIAGVVSVPPREQGHEGDVKLKVLPKSGGGQVGFGGVVYEDEEEDAEMRVKLGDMRDWKLVTL